ncbi:MAG: rRNA pseudouridine synthase [Bacilli bacterium]|jgi:16S rRNA pseudouridine516 synthase|nr:rRNA pseudouridine synthase [Bacilli bacterium]
MRLDKFLSDNGFGTRKEVKKLIKSQQVIINNHVMMNSAYHLKENDVIKVNNEIIERRDHIYLMMNKPKNYVCTSDDINPYVISLIDQYYHKDLFCVGRLDKDTTGLLLITNDGTFAHNLIKPNKNVTKTYHALITNKITNKDIELFKKGIIINDNYQCKPATLKVIDEFEKTSLVEIVITEGKFHQVKKMIKAINQEVIELKRIKIGLLSLDESLDLGEYRLLSNEEYQLLMNKE